MKRALLPPRPVPWTMKPLSSARTRESTLPDGRIELRIEHDLLRGVTPQMLVWWWRNIEGEMELGGKTYPRYLIWHPVDHIYFKVVERLPDGSVGVGSKFHIVEAFGGDLRHLINVVLHIRRLEETEITVEVPVAGFPVMRIYGQLVPREGDTQLTSTMTLGFSGWLGRLGLNRVLIGRHFPAERRRAWLKHSVEEIGNLQFFLPDLYRRHALSG